MPRCYRLPVGVQCRCPGCAAAVRPRCAAAAQGRRTAMQSGNREIRLVGVATDQLGKARRVVVEDAEKLTSILTPTSANSDEIPRLSTTGQKERALKFRALVSATTVQFGGDGGESNSPTGVRPCSPP